MKFPQVNIINPGEKIELGFPKPNLMVSYFLIFCAGCILPFAFAPFHYSLVAVVSLTIYAYLSYENNRHLFGLGLVFGLGYFGIGVSWVFVSMYNYGNMSLILSAFATLLWVLIMAVFPGFTSFVANKFKTKFNKYWYFLAILPACWFLFEWLRSWILTGFPWVLLGSSQITSPFAGFLPIIGELALGWLLMVFVGLIVLTSVKSLKVKIISFLTIAVLWVVATELNKIEWTQPNGKYLQVALVQGNIPIRKRWNPNYHQQIVNTYLNETKNLKNVDLVLWPEAALPIRASRLSQNEIKVLDSIVPNGSLISGIVNDTDKIYNSLIKIDHEINFYNKRHLVPFGEYTPLANNIVGWLMNNLQIPMSNFSHGTNENSVFTVKDSKIASSICYEIIFSNLIRLDAGIANILLTVSNDTWFSGSLAPEQHLAIARVRAKENGKPIIRATNDGVTAIIKPDGTVQARLPIGKLAVLQEKVVAYQGTTFYQKYGYLSTWFILTFFFILTIYASIKSGFKITKH